jgi:hypothetical protein
MISMSDVLTSLGQCSGSCDNSQHNEWDGWGEWKMSQIGAKDIRCLSINTIVSV